VQSWVSVAVLQVLSLHQKLGKVIPNQSLLQSDGKAASKMSGFVGLCSVIISTFINGDEYCVQKTDEIENAIEVDVIVLPIIFVL